MQLELGRKGDYTIRAMLDLARHYGGGRRKSREISAAMDIPQRYLPQILSNLVHHDLLVAVAGPDGGYSLAREPGTITLLEAIEAAEGAIGSDECALRGGPCDWTNVCPFHQPWARAQQALIRELERTTFQELAERDSAIERGDETETGHRPRGPRRGVRSSAPDTQ